MTKVWLTPWLQSFFASPDIFTRVFQLEGIVYRRQPGRVTFATTLNNKPCFVKLHSGVGWKEIFKNLIHLRWPILGATAEFKAISRLHELNVPTLTIVGYGCRGINPAHQQSFLITEALQNTLSLEELCQLWQKKAPPFSFKLALIKKVATIARTLHTHGINHRDFYICHFLLQNPSQINNLTEENLFVYLIDLHRAQIRKQVPKRWLIKDLSGIYFSTLDFNFSERDYLRFLHIYFDQPLRNILKNEAALLKTIHQKAWKLYKKHYEKSHHQKTEKSIICAKSHI